MAHKITIDVTTRQVTADGAQIRLTRSQFDMLAYLARYPGAVRTRDQLRDAAGKVPQFDDRSVDCMIKRLRAKAFSAEIETIYSVGYAWAGERPLFRSAQGEPTADPGVMVFQTEPCATIDHADAALGAMTSPHLKAGWRLTSWHLTWPTEADSAHGIAVLSRAV